jgi:hypothetical protein
VTSSPIVMHLKHHRSELVLSTSRNEKHKPYEIGHLRRQERDSFSPENIAMLNFNISKFRTAVEHTVKEASMCSGVNLFVNIVNSVRRADARSKEQYTLAASRVGLCFTT